MRTPGRHGAESLAGAGYRWRGDLAVRSGTAHRAPARHYVTAGNTTFPSAEAAPLSSSDTAAGDGGSSGSEQRLQRCQQLRAARPPATAGLEQPPAEQRGAPLPARDVYAGRAAAALLTQRSPPAPGAAPPAAASRGGTDGAAGLTERRAAEAAAPGRAAPGAGGRRRCPRGPAFGARGFNFCGHRPESSGGSRIHRHRHSHRFRGQRRAAAGPRPAGQGRARPFPAASLSSSLPSHQSPPSVGGGAPAAARPGTLQAE